MKLLLLYILFLFAGLNNIYAQCTPDTISTPGIYRDCTTGLPHATAGTPYSCVIQVKMPTSVSYSGNIVSVDSFVIRNITGLPSGFAFSTNPSSKSFLPGSNDCLYINETGVSAGNYPFSISIRAYLYYFIHFYVDSIVNCYAIKIDTAAGVINLAALYFDVSQNYPNPVNGVTEIYFSGSASQSVDFTVVNLLGKVVYQKTFRAESGAGRISLDSKDFAPGIYMYHLSNGKKILSRRMIMTRS